MEQAYQTLRLVAGFLLHFPPMRTTIILLSALALAACNQTSETRTSVDTSGATTTTKTTTVEVAPKVDTATTAEIKRDVKEGVNDAKAAAKETVQDVKKEIPTSATITTTSTKKKP